MLIYLQVAVASGGSTNGTFEIPIESNLKSYYIEKTYNGKFGEGEVIAPVEGTSGNNRFYIMALEDLNPLIGYTWYKNLSVALIDTVSLSQNDFGMGESNTTKIYSLWKAETYASQNNLDIWIDMEDKVNSGWFLPTKTEWEALGAAFNIDNSNCSKYGLNNWYWTSSLNSGNYAYYIDLENQFIGVSNVDDNSNYVRLSRKF